MRGCTSSSAIALALLGIWSACSKSNPPPPPAPAASASASVAASASAAAPAPKFDVILITIDCLRADQPWTGYPRDVAPRLTALEKKSVDYTMAYSLSSYTSMSIGGLLSSRIPNELDRDGYFFGSYGDKNLFFPEVLQKAGIKTMAAHAHGYFKGTGLDQGFDKWEIVPDLKWNNLTDENVTSPQLEGIAETLLSDPALETDRFFAWFHFLDPHDAYMAHEGIDWGHKQTRDKYDVEVTFTDRYIGKLLDFIDGKSWGKRTVIIVTGDHGEAFGEHKQYLHGFELWEHLVRVPLLFVVPGVTPRKLSAQRSAIDVAPTILDLFELPPEPSFRGTSLLSEIKGAAPEPRDILVDLPQTSDNDRRRALISGRKKLIAYGASDYAVVYDLEADPDETKQILSGPLYDEMKAKYKAATKDLKDVPPTKCRENCLTGGYQKK